MAHPPNDQKYCSDSDTFFNEDNLAEAIEWVKRNCPIGVFVSSNQQFTAQPISFVN